MKLNIDFTQFLSHSEIIMLLVAIGLFLFIKFFGQTFGSVFKRHPKPCLICGKETRDIITDYKEKNKEIPYCREHLLEKFAQAISSSLFNSIVCYPYLEKYYNSMYSYYPVTELLSFDFKKEDVEFTISLLKTIPINKCSECDQKARHLYFSQSIYNSGPLTYITDLKNLQGIYLCSKHLLEKITIPLKNNPHDFDEYGLVLPYLGEGIYFSTPL